MLEYSMVPFAGKALRRITYCTSDVQSRRFTRHDGLVNLFLNVTYLYQVV